VNTPGETPDFSHSRPHSHPFPTPVGTNAPLILARQARDSLKSIVLLYLRLPNYHGNTVMELEWSGAGNQLIRRVQTSFKNTEAECKNL
jgi:hypothetical protein